jgi:hypothetical protein
MHQDVQGFATGRCAGGIGRSGGGEVAGWVRRRLAQRIDVVKLLMRIARKHKVMMRQMVIALVEPEVKHHTAAGWLVLTLVLERAGGLSADQLAVRAYGVCV